ncbi:MAG: hypothetical protein RLZZ164_620 [Actinomycetota bacterium]|jgi:fucose permease
MRSITTRTWFIGIFILFACRGILMTTWSNQGPALKDAFALSNSSMGLYQMTISLGSIVGVLFAGRLLHRLGSRYLSLISYLLMAVGIVGLGFAVQAHNFILAVTFTALIGLPFGSADFDNNFEAGEINRQSGRNRVPMLHLGYSLMVLLGAALTGLLLQLDVSTSVDFILIGVVVAIASIFASYMIKPDNGKIEAHKDGAGKQMTVIDVLRNKRYLKIVTIAFAFVVTEGAAVLWIPITLTTDGMPASSAAVAFTCFAAGMVVMRFFGGRIADKFGRESIILWLAVIAILGVVTFMLTPVIHIPFVGIALWGIGNSIGISMAVAAMADEPEGQHAKQTLLWIVVYFANFTVGPVLGALSTVIGNYGSFLFPIAALVAAALVRSSVRQES